MSTSCRSTGNGSRRATSRRRGRSRRGKAASSGRGSRRKRFIGTSGEACIRCRQSARTSGASWGGMGRRRPGIVPATGRGSARPARCSTARRTRPWSRCGRLRPGCSPRRRRRRARRGPSPGAPPGGGGNSRRLSYNDRVNARRRVAAAMALLLLSFGCAAPGKEETSVVESGHAPVNGIRMYYEVHGPAGGTPLLLLHGGGSTIEVTFGKILPFLARHRRVIAVEEQGHGRTSDRDQPLRFETSADDVAALLRHLRIETADLFGFSNGASVALQTAIRHPGVVRKLVFASSMTKKAGARPEFWEFMARADFSNMPQPLKDAFLKVNPDPAKLRVMHDKDAERMRSFADVPDQALESPRASTLT